MELRCCVRMKEAIKWNGAAMRLNGLNPYLTLDLLCVWLDVWHGACCNISCGPAAMRV